MSSQRALKRDEFITPELTNHLFQTDGFPFGLDLAAINIQRGRDHGIPTYTSWREPCGLSPIQNWDDLSKVVGAESAKRISFAYRSVHDIDLFVGGISERPVVGGIVGPTFACIIAQQFSNLRKGDRFWYENSNLPNSFTLFQLNSLRRVSFSQIICRSLGGGTLQPHIFLPHEIKGNERILCGLGPLAPIDLRPWLDNGLPENKEDAWVSNNVTLTITTTSINPLLDLNNSLRKNVSIDVIPNGVIGLQRPDKHKNTIDDKLDFQGKILSKTSTFTNSETTTKNPFIINNVSVDLLNNKGTTLLPPLKIKNRIKKSVLNTSTVRAETKQLSKDFALPHKVTFDGPESDQYEIEINIKPTNKVSQQQQHRFDNYQSQNYASFSDGHKSYSFMNQITKSTQPPTIIYLDDQTDTSKTPGFLQNIFNFAQRTTTKLPNKLDNINSHFLSSPEVSSNKPTQNYNPHSYTNSDVSQPQESNSVFSFTIRPNSKPNNYYNTLQRPEILDKPHYPDQSPISFGQSSIRPIYSPQQTYNYYYFNKGPFYTNRPDSEYPFPQRNENYNDLGRSDLDLTDENDAIEISTVNNDYDYYDYDINLTNKSLDKIKEIEKELSHTKSTIIQNRNISVNDNYVLPIINISKNIEITTMPKNSKTNIYSHDHDTNNSDLPASKDAQSRRNIIDKR